MAYAPFGEGYAGGSPTYVTFTSTGFAPIVDPGQNDNGTLDDFLFRHYSPGQGRWISPDPAALAVVDPTNPQTWNRYAYVANNPLSYVDPSGLNRAFPGQGGCNSDAYDCGSGGGFPSDPGAGGGGDDWYAQSSSDCPICTGPYGSFGTAGIAGGWSSAIMNPGPGPVYSASDFQFSARADSNSLSAPPTLYYSWESAPGDVPPYDFSVDTADSADFLLLAQNGRLPPSADPALQAMRQLADNAARNGQYGPRTTPPPATRPVIDPNQQPEMKPNEPVWMRLWGLWPSGGGTFTELPLVIMPAAQLCQIQGNCPDMPYHGPI
jgi:RHS repeat-associated protein